MSPERRIEEFFNVEGPTGLLVFSAGICCGSLSPKEVNLLKIIHCSSTLLHYYLVLYDVFSIDRLTSPEYLFNWVVEKSTLLHTVLVNRHLVPGTKYCCARYQNRARLEHVSW